MSIPYSGNLLREKISQIGGKWDCVDIHYYLHLFKICVRGYMALIRLLYRSDGWVYVQFFKDVYLD